MSRVRAVFLGTPELAETCLREMLKHERFEIVGVLSQPDRPSGRRLKLTPSPVKALALAHGLPVLTPEKASDPAVVEIVRGWNAEVAVVVAFGQILRQNFLDLFPAKVVNVHASLLPRWRGAAPIQRALMAGDSATGVSLQVMVKKLDAGPVIGERAIELTPEFNAVDLYGRCADLGARLLTDELLRYLRGDISPVAQDESSVTLAPKIDKAEAEIDWTGTAEDIQNLVRGLAMGPVAQTRRGGKLLKLHRVLARSASDPARRPGEVMAILENSVLVQCGRGSLELLVVQPESRAQMPITEYGRGYPFTIGDVLGFERAAPPPDRP